MAPTLRKRPQCHYCGKRLNTSKRKQDKIHCDNCLADNYFDASNEVLDVPESEVNRLIPHIQLPEIESESDVFCKKCLTNQAFYVQAISNYLPDEDDPRYSNLLEGLPEFERNLELRYPQCCDQCEPRVADQIQRANYMAKSDHLRRVLHRTHDRRRNARLRFRSLLISAAGLAQIVSLTIQLLWHVLASQAASDHVVPGISLIQCLRQWPVSTSCTNYFASLLPSSLLIGVLCIWWNPMWQHRLTGKEGRLIGLSKYYQIQISILAFRWMSWAVMQDLPLAQKYGNAMHTVLFIILSASSVYAITSIVRIDNTPLVDWRQVQAPLVNSNQFRHPTQPVISPPSSQESSKIDLLNFAAPVRVQHDGWRPPTPPGEEMDWEKEDQTFNPRPTIPKPEFEQQSPFYGVLPAKPVRGSLNPKAPPPPQPRKAIGVPPGFFGLNKSQSNEQGSSFLRQERSAAFMPAKFFHERQETDTGLENIFDRMFSVGDPSEVTHTPLRPSSKDIFGQEIPEITSRRRASSSRTIQDSQIGQQTIAKALSIIIIITLGMVFSSLCTLDFVYPTSVQAPSRVIPYTAAIPALHLIEKMFQPKQTSVTAIVVHVIAISLALTAHVVIPSGGSIWVPGWNKLVMAVAGVLMVGEAYRLVRLQSTPFEYQSHIPTNSVSSSVPQPIPNQEQNFLEQPLARQYPPQQTLEGYAEPLRQRSPTQLSQNNLSNADFGTVRKRDSNESIGSVSSINTTSTAPGWKTPQHTGRKFDWQSSDRYTPTSGRKNSSVSSSLGGLGGLNLNDFGTGSGIAGPRTRQTPRGYRY